MQTQAYSPVVLVLDGALSDGIAAKKWVDESEYHSAQVADAFQALEEMSDFTMPYRPEVIVLDADSSHMRAAGFKRTLDAVHTSDVPVIAVSEGSIHSTAGDGLELAPAELSEHMELLISHAPSA